MLVYNPTQLNCIILVLEFHCILLIKYLQAGSCSRQILMPIIVFFFIIILS